MELGLLLPGKGQYRYLKGFLMPKSHSSVSRHGLNHIHNPPWHGRNIFRKLQVGIDGLSENIPHAASYLVLFAISISTAHGKSTPPEQLRVGTPTPMLTLFISRKGSLSDRQHAYNWFWTQVCVCRSHSSSQEVKLLSKPTVNFKSALVTNPTRTECRKTVPAIS